MAFVKVGFVGFGEVASVFSQPICESGAEVAAYDVLQCREGGKTLLESRTRAPGVQFRPLADVVGNANYVLSTVTTQVAVEVAASCALHLGPGQIYVDLNSMAPSRKVEVGRIVRGSGADFVEGAILGAVGATGAGTRVLVGGEKANQAAETLTRLGLQVSYYSAKIGQASMFKMLRSVFSKGLEALLLEFLLAGRRAGIEQDVWQDIVDFMTCNPFEQVASNWVRTHAVACERRYQEMTQVEDTLRDIGIEPIMTAATEAFFSRSLALGLAEAFREKPESMQEVIDFLEKRVAKG